MSLFDKYEAVSFDVFDTLIARTVQSPSDVFRLVERKAQQGGLQVSGFAGKRIEAERGLRLNGKIEVTLGQIYRVLSGDYGWYVSGKLKELEIAFERAVARPRADAMELYYSAKRAGKIIIITSDMYLPSSIIQSILRKCGYDGWDHFFVSSESKATKADGGLFDLVVERTGIPAGSILHVGDNKRSDVIVPRLHGLSSRYLSPRTARGKSSCLGESVCEGIIRCHGDGKEYLDDVGFRSFGPLMVGVCNWLAERFDSEHIEAAFFLSRDGLVLKKSFDRMFPGLLRTVYMYGSRKALQTPSLHMLGTLEETCEKMFLPSRLSCSSFFRRLGLDDGRVKAVLTAYGIDPEIELKAQDFRRDPQALRAFDLLKGEIDDVSRQACGLLLDYLDQIGFRDKVALVDIGWYGNMQVSLEAVCKRYGVVADIHGFYIGLNPYGCNQRGHQMEGYLFSGDHNYDLFELESNFSTLFEIMCSATHGSTSGYRRMETGRIEPVLGRYDGPERDSGEKAEVIRQSALSFVDQWVQSVGSLQLDLDPHCAFSRLARVGNSPSALEAKEFGDWALDDYGVVRYMAKPRSGLTYLRHPTRLVRDLSRTSWKVGFLKRLIRAPLPYAAILNGVHRLYRQFKYKKNDKIYH